ncbi:MAG: polyketide cyclase [Marivita sp. XM-24bin2]|nr:MAG: polyketide cyclase [Marivita sp. XM-24bin2]
MKGFDPSFDNCPDYIFGVTRALLEGRDLCAAMQTYYHPDVIRRMPGGILFGVHAEAAMVIERLAQFPDCTPLGEDVLWSGAPEVGFLASLRSLTQATHLGDGPFGPASGRRIRYREISECYAKANRISDVWSVTDTGGILRQLGIDPKAWAQERLAHLDPETQPFRPAIDAQGPYTGRGNDNQWGQAFAELLSRVMSGGFSVIPDQYDRAAQADYPGGHTVHGTEGVEAFWLGLRAAFPSADFEVHHQIGMDEPNMPPRAALRWSLTGRHDGWGAFGAPTGAEVHVMGLSHAEFGPRGLRREWTLCDETAIWLQILAHQG